MQVYNSRGADVNLDNYLSKDNVTPFVPDSDYEPSTKKYVDDNSGSSNTKILTQLAQVNFGDSITLGQGATVGKYYNDLFESDYNLALTSYAESGKGVYQAIKNHHANIVYGHSSLCTVMAGFNDVRRGGNSVKTMAKIENAIKSMIINHFLDRHEIAKSTSPNVIESNWNNAYSGTAICGKENGVYSNVISGYLEYTFEDDNVVFMGFAGDGVTEIYGSVEVTIDGVSQGTFSFNEGSDGISDGSYNNNIISKPLYFGNLGDGSHTIRVTKLDASRSDYFGHLRKSNNCEPFIIIESTKMDATGYATSPANASDVIIDELNALFNSISTTFLSGYPVLVGQTNTYFDVTTDLYTDHIHANDNGHRAIYNGLWKSIIDYGIANNISPTGLLLLNNQWEGVNKFNKGFKVIGKDSAPTGNGIEIEFDTGNNTGYITAYDRDTSTWRKLIIRGIIEMRPNNVLCPSGSFTTVDGKTVTVTNGLITSIV